MKNIPENLSWTSVAARVLGAARFGRRRAWMMAALGVVAMHAAPSWSQGAPRVKFDTSMGAIVIEVYPDKAPKTVENFLTYVRDKHYDGTIFHRVIGNFMIQGGGFDTAYNQKPTRAPVTHEGREALSRGGPKNVVGTVAMARTQAPHSATAQFFINVKDNDFLNPVEIPPGDPVPRFEYGGRVMENVPRAYLANDPRLFGYTVFGKVVSGMEVVDAIKGVPTGAGGPFPTDVPKTPVIIRSAVVMP